MGVDIGHSRVRAADADAAHEIIAAGHSLYWMTSMYDVGEVSHDPMLNGLDEASYKP